MNVPRATPTLEEVRAAAESRSPERRFLSSDRLRIRARDEEEEDRRIEGHFILFDVEDGFAGFREVIRPSAFRRSLANGADVRGLWNHDSSFVLGRRASGTLELEQDDRGIFARIEPPPTQWARDLVASMDRGDVDGASFQFYTIRDQVTERENEPALREILEAELVDVSVVTFPFYEETQVGLRSWLTAVRAKVGERPEELLEALARWDARELPASDRELFDRWREVLGRCSDGEDPAHRGELDRMTAELDLRRRRSLTT